MNRFLNVLFMLEVLVPMVFLPAMETTVILPLLLSWLKRASRPLFSFDSQPLLAAEEALTLREMCMVLQLGFILTREILVGYF